MSLSEKRETYHLLSQLVGKGCGSLVLRKHNVCSVLSLYTFPQQNNRLGLGLGGVVGAGGKHCSSSVVCALCWGFESQNPFLCSCWNISSVRRWTLQDPPSGKGEGLRG